MSKFTVKKIEEIKANVEELRAILSNDVKMSQFTEKRVELNINIIQALLGAEVVIPKNTAKSAKLKFRHRLPNVSEVAEICDILATYITDVEETFLSALQNMKQAADDMTIPAGIIKFQPVELIEKPTNKKLSEMALNGNGGVAFSQIALTPMDIMNISKMAYEARSRENKKIIMLSAGVVVTVAVAASLYFFVLKKDKAVESEEVVTEGIDEEIDVDLETEEIPVVTIEEQL